MPARLCVDSSFSFKHKMSHNSNPITNKNLRKSLFSKFYCLTKVSYFKNDVEFTTLLGVVTSIIDVFVESANM